ncbi:MAG: ABC transporter permease [Candidatus Acidiferrales bacterium]
MNATAANFSNNPCSGISMPPNRLFGAYLTEAKYESLRMLRTPAFAIPFLGLPAMLLLLFGVLIFGNELRADPNGAKFVFTAFSVLGMMGPGMFGFGAALAMEREQGLLKLKRALPMPQAAGLLAKMAMAILFGVIVMITMIAAMPLAHVPLTTTQALNVALINILGTLPFCALGLFIGAMATGKTALAFVNIAYQVMMHLSGLFYPLPTFLRKIAPIWPTFHLQQLALAAAGAPSRGSTAVHVGVLVGVTIAATMLAVRRLSRVG